MVRIQTLAFPPLRQLPLKSLPTVFANLPSLKFNHPV